MDRRKKLTVLAASLVLGLSSAAFAQGTGMSAPMAMSGGMSSGMSSGTVDYSLLTKCKLDYVDLMQARARGLSENEVATVAKISEATGTSFRDVVDNVLEGDTFSKIAEMNNLKLSDILDVTDEKTMISNYEATYQSTGKMAMKGNGMSGSSMSGGMSGSSTTGTMGTTGTGTMGTNTTGTGTGMTGGATTATPAPN